ncbi:MAG: hypothetical protein HZY79_15635 [Rhodoblastus sp.]|nr:MAG: hypothetical protein HZY79_15635 [Rhodoblastus sp.]
MIRRLIRPVIRFAFWAFERPAPGLDLALGVLSGGWAAAAAVAPAVFDRSSYAVIGLMPPALIILAMAGLAAAHLTLALRSARWWRIGPLFLSAFVWLSIALGFAAVEAWPEVVVYGLVAAGCLLGALYVETDRAA